MTDETGVIWCPACDTVLRWEAVDHIERQLTDDAMEHLRAAHNHVPKSRLLTRPAPVAP